MHAKNETYVALDDPLRLKHEPNPESPGMVNAKYVAFRMSTR